jgi:hypothetical protein
MVIRSVSICSRSYDISALFRLYYTFGHKASTEQSPSFELLTRTIWPGAEKHQLPGIKNAGNSFADISNAVIVVVCLVRIGYLWTSLLRDKKVL